MLRTVNPSPYLFFLDLDGFQLVGSSPEVLVRLVAVNQQRIDKLLLAHQPRSAAGAALLMPVLLAFATAEPEAQAVGSASSCFAFATIGFG